VSRDESIRVFCAVELPREVRVAAAAHAERLRRSFTGVRASWARPEGLHITLKFVGEIAALRVEALARAAGAAVPLASTGAPLGLLPPGMPYEETPVSLEPGDSVLLYSDGVVDAQNADGEEFGEARLLDIVQQMHRLPPPALVDRVFDAIDQHAAGAPQFDDITLLVVRRLE